MPLEQIKRDVDRSITRNIDWFTPEDEKNLVGPELVTLIANPILMEFLKAIASSAGTLLFTSVVHYFQTRGKAAPAPLDKPSPEQLETAAAQAQSAAGGMTAEEFHKKMDTITAALQQSLQTLMPEDAAAGIAGDYRATLMTNLGPR